MGMFGRFREKAAARANKSGSAVQVHEVAPVGGHFRPTSSERIDKMYKEVHDFAQVLKECERQLKQLEIASAAVFIAAGDTLSTPLPHVYQVDPQGSAIPIVPPDELRQDAASPVGTAVRVQDLVSISQKHTSELEASVLAPMRGWIKDYRSFKDKLSVLDNRRLEFDAERRAFHKLELRKVHQQQATDKADPELMGKLEAKSGDVAAKRNIYNTHEQELYNGLAALINNAKSVRIHLANAMRIQAQAFGSAVA